MDDIQHEYFSGQVLIGADYTRDEQEFLSAVDRYRVESRRPFATLREFFAVFLSLGYRRIAEPGELPKFKSRRGKRS